MTSKPIDPRKSIRKLNLLGIATVVLLVGGFGAWGTTMHLSGAVIASGVIVVESNVKKIQHPTGGVVGEILVAQGDVVEKGQLLLRLDDTVARASVSVIRSQLDELLARQARLLAERDRADAIQFPDELLARQEQLGSSLAGEQKLFESRRRVLMGQDQQLRQRLDQIREEIRGLSSQRDAKDKELGLIALEFKGVEDLYKKNLISIQRFMALQRDQARLEGERGNLTAEIARARARINETELQIIQLEEGFRNDVLKEMRENEGKIAELRERYTAAADQLQRVELRAPQAGVVHQLNVHTVGGVITNAETVMLIVPLTDDLVVDARISPADVDQISVGAVVQARIMAANQRTTPDIPGVVTQVSADLTRDPPSGTNPGASYFQVRISLSKEAIHRLKGLRLVPGMPVEAFIETGSRTPLDYLIKPLREQIARTFRER